MDLEDMGGCVRERRSTDSGEQPALMLITVGGREGGSCGGGDNSSGDPFDQAPALSPPLVLETDDPPVLSELGRLADYDFIKEKKCNHYKSMEKR